MIKGDERVNERGEEEGKARLALEALGLAAGGLLVGEGHLGGPLRVRGEVGVGAVGAWRGDVRGGPALGGPAVDVLAVEGVLRGEVNTERGVSEGVSSVGAGLSRGGGCWGDGGTRGGHTARTVSSAVPARRADSIATLCSGSIRMCCLNSGSCGRRRGGSERDLLTWNVDERVSTHAEH